MHSDIDNMADGAASIAIAVYLVAVVYQGNLYPFLNEFKKEVGYLEFIVAVYLLYKLYQVDSVKPLVGMFLVGAILAAIIQASRNFDAGLFEQYSRGSISLFDLVLKLGKGT